MSPAAPAAPPASPPTRLQVGLWLAVLAAIVGLAIRNFDLFQTGAFRDDAIYLMMARSVTHPDAAWLWQSPALGNLGSGTFPLGFPLLLTPIVYLFPNSLAAAKLFSLAATLANASLLFWGWRWLCPSRSQWWGLAVCALYALWPWTVLHSTAVMSEAVFLTVLLATMLLSAQRAQGRHGWGWPVWWAAGLALLVNIRTVGWAFAAGLVVYLLLTVGRRFWLELARLGGAAAVALVVIALVTGTGLNRLLPLRYLEHQTEFMAGHEGGSRMRGRSFISIYALLIEDHLKIDFRQAAVPLGPAEAEAALATRLGVTWVPSLIGVITSGVMAAGLAHWLLRERWNVLQLTALAYLPLLMLWSWNTPRFLYPVQPQFALVFLLGIEWGLAWIARGARGPTAARAALVVVVGAMGVNFARLSLQPLESRPHIGDLQTRTAWLAANTPAEAVVMTAEPRLDYLYGGRHTVPFPVPDLTATGLAAYLAEQQVDYILIAPDTEWQADGYAPAYTEAASHLLDLLADRSSPGPLAEPVYEAENIRVFRVLPGS